MRIDNNKTIDVDNDDEALQEFLEKGYQGHTLSHLLETFKEHNVSLDDFKSLNCKERNALIKTMGISISDTVLLNGALQPRSLMTTQNGTTTVRETTQSSKVAPPEVSTETSYSSYYYESDCRKHTGYVGLQNQGATCYLNSLLQALFHLSTFRMSVYNIPVSTNIENEDKQSPSPVPLALQKLFYSLEFRDSAGSTSELTTSFGWTQSDSYVQHDVQELLRKLIDCLTEKMKSTPSSGEIEKLLTGQTVSYVKCCEIDYTSTRVEDYMDLQLAVKGCANIIESFKEYTSIETLDGDNKYQVEKDGQKSYTVAKKGVWFKSFPPVLMMHLRRFEFDMRLGQMARVNDSFEFSQEIDLSSYLIPEDFDPNHKATTTPEDSIYVLHSVLVHVAMGMYGGHYYAFVRPNNGNQWFKFNDSMVTKVSEYEAINKSFGSNGYSSSSACAYMLIYVRKSMVDEILFDITEDRKPHHLKQLFEAQLKKEEEDRKRKEKDRNEMEVRVWLDKDIKENTEKDKIKLIDTKDYSGSFRIERKITFGQFKEELERRYDIPVNRQKLWYVDSSIFRSITTSDSCRLCDLSAFYMGHELFRAHIYIQVLEPPHDIGLLIFLKYYSPSTRSIEFLGSVVVNNSKLVADLCQIVNTIRESPNEELECYEEAYELKHIPNGVSIYSAYLSNGKTLWFQPVQKSHEPDQTSVIAFYNSIKNRRLVQFISCENSELYWKAKKVGDGSEKEYSTTCECFSTDTYEQLQNNLSQHINATASHIRFLIHDSFKLGYRKDYDPLNMYSISTKLLKDLIYSTDIKEQYLYYEVLDIPVVEFQRMMKIKIEYWDTHCKQIAIKEICADKQSNYVKLFIDALKLASKELPEFFEGDIPDLDNLDDEKTEDLKHKYHIIKSSSGRGNIVNLEDKPNEYHHEKQLRIEKQPQEILDSDGNRCTQKMVQVVHLELSPGYYHNKKLNNYHSTPFWIYVTENDTGSTLWKRIKEKLQVTEDWPMFVVDLYYAYDALDIDEDDLVFLSLQKLKKMSTNYRDIAIGLCHAQPKKSSPTHSSSSYSYWQKELKINST